MSARASFRDGLALLAILSCLSAIAPVTAQGRAEPWPAKDIFASPTSGDDSWRAVRLAQSPRRHEVATLPLAGRRLQAFVAYPATDRKVPVVLMLAEDNGLNNWAREQADEIAAMGYVVVVPDLLSGYGPNGGGQDAFPDKPSAEKALTALKDPVIVPVLHAWADHAKRLPQANGKLAVVGFAWGAGRAFWFASQRKDLSATFIFYDWAPKGIDFAAITAPVYGFYADNDPRVTNTLPTTRAAMAAAGKRFATEFYPGSEHMFVRLGAEAGNVNAANVKARHASLARLQDLLGGI